MTETLVLLDENDREIGTEEKIAAHVQGKLHRAFSIYLFNSRGQLLLTRRAAGKYHSAGLWTNTCCGHPRPGEPLEQAARRRLREEMGMDCKLRRAFQFSYRADLSNGLTEHEIDHVFIGTYDGPVHADADEADAFEWVDPHVALRDVQAHPEKYTVWMALSVARAVECFQSQTPGAKAAGTFHQAALWRLEALWAALYRTPCPESAKALASMMLAPWGEQPVPAVPLWRSDIGDDHSPFEFSVAFSEGKSDLRLLVEGQGGGNLASQREACLRLNESLGQKGSDLRRLMMLVDLLIPETAELEDPLFFLWHMVSLSSDSLRVKSYFNPNVRGAGRANELMKAAFERLGLDAPWRTFEEAQRRLRGKDLLLFCLDLEDTPSARVKIYPHPQGATAEDLERVSQLGSKHVPGEVAEFCRVLTGSSGPYVRGPRVARTPIVYLAFTRNEETPSDITVQVPIRFYAADDAVARDRVCGYLQLRGLDPAPYERALEAVSKRPWKAGRGLNAWVSLRTGSNPPLVTVYFAAELYRVLPRGEESGLF